MGNFVCLRNQEISFQFNFGSMNPPTERPIPPPWESEAILPPDIPDAWGQRAVASGRLVEERRKRRGRMEEGGRTGRPDSGI